MQFMTRNISCAHVTPVTLEAQPFHEVKIAVTF
jgi:hypothetical protein